VKEINLIIHASVTLSAPKSVISQSGKVTEAQSHLVGLTTRSFVNLPPIETLHPCARQAKRRLVRESISIGPSICSTQAVQTV
jgi:hypothetical protein